MATRLVLLSVFLCAASAQEHFNQQQQQQQQQQFTSEARVLQKPFIEILKKESAGPGPDGSYAFSFEDSAGGRREEISQATGPNTFAVEGTYSYTNEDGDVVEFHYRADKTGFHVQSPALPRDHPVPPHAEEQLKIGEEQRRQGIVFDQRGFIVSGQQSSN